MQIGESVRAFVLDDALVTMPDFYVLPNKFSLQARRDRVIEQRQVEARQQRGVALTEAQAARGLNNAVLADGIRTELTEQEPFRLYAESWVGRTVAKDDDPGLNKVYPGYPSKRSVNAIMRTAIEAIKLGQQYPNGAPPVVDAQIQQLFRTNEIRIQNAFDYPTQGNETVEEAIDVVENARIEAIGRTTIFVEGGNVKYAEFPGSKLQRTAPRRTRRVTTPDDNASDTTLESLEVSDDDDDDTGESGEREVLRIEKDGTPPTDLNARRLWEEGVVVLNGVAFVADLADSRERIRKGRPEDDPGPEIDGLGLYTAEVRNDPTADLAIRTYEGVPTPGAFHGDRVRAYRRLAFAQLRDAVNALAPTLGIRVTQNQTLFHEPLVGALTVHTGTGGGQSWIRDNGRASKGVVLEAWLNMGNNTEDFVYVPGTHTFKSGGDKDLRTYPYNSLRAFDANQEVARVEPGAMVVYFRTLVHQTFRPSARPDDRNMRLYVGAAIYAGRNDVRAVQTFTDNYLANLAVAEPVIGPTVAAWRTPAERAVLTSRLQISPVPTIPRTTVINASYAGTPYTADEQEIYRRRAVVLAGPSTPTTSARLGAPPARGHTPIRL